MVSEVPLRDHIERMVADLRVYFERLIGEQEKTFAQALHSQAIAVGKAEANATAWRAEANEWRGAMTDREKSFATVASIVELRRSIDDLRQSRDVTAGQTIGASALWGYIMGVVGLVAAVVALAVNL